MKKIFHIICVTVLCSVSCTEQGRYDAFVENPGDGAYATAVQDEGLQTRVSFSENRTFNELNVLWKAEGEAFSVFYGTGSQTPVTFAQTEASEDGRTATFMAENYSLEKGRTYYAFYPALDSEMYPASVSLDLSVQDGTSYAAGEDRTFMIAETVCEDAGKPLNFRFRHLTAAVRLDVRLPDEADVTSVAQAVVSAESGLLMAAEYDITRGLLNMNKDARKKGCILLNGPFEVVDVDGKKTVTLYFRMFQGTVEDLRVTLLIGDEYYSAGIMARENIMAGNWYYTVDAKAADDSLLPVLKLMSFNIRTSTTDNDFSDLFSGRRWYLRRSSVVSLIKKESPVVFGVQEAVKEQIDYLKGQLTEYGCYGVGRDDGANEGEIMAIFYKKSDVAMGRYGTFWLSETPDTPSKGWGANYYRTATWAEFTHTASGRKFFHLNTHLDHETAAARTNSILLIIEKLEELNPDSHPVVITGDFNSKPDDSILVPLKAVMDNTRDSSPVTDSSVTYNNYGDDDTKTKIVDHIFISSGFKSVEYRTVTDKSGSGNYVSDHYPITSLLIFD